MRSPLLLRSLLAVVALNAPGCSVVSQSTPPPRQSADQNSVNDRSGTMLVLAANSLDLVDRLVGAIDTVARKTPRGGTRTPYSLLQQIVTESGTGDVTHASGSFSYRAVSKAGAELTNGQAEVDLVVSGTEDASRAVAVEQLSLELIPPNIPAKSFTILTRASGATGEQYDLDFSAIGAFIQMLKAYYPAAPTDALSGQMELSLESNISTLSGTGLSITNDAYDLAVDQLKVTSDAGSKALKTLVLSARVTGHGSAGVSGTISVDTTTKVNGDGLPVVIKGGFTPQGGIDAGS